MLHSRHVLERQSAPRTQDPRHVLERWKQTPDLPLYKLVPESAPSLPRAEARDNPADVTRQIRGHLQDKGETRPASRPTIIRAKDVVHVPPRARILSMFHTTQRILLCLMLI